MSAEVLRYAAFVHEGRGGNPAGVVLDASELDETQMQRIAAELDYSETAFVFPRDEPNVYDVRYFTPQQEVPFCGHATIASAVALAQRSPADEMVFYTEAGLVTLTTEDTGEGVLAELTSVSPRVAEPPPGLVDAVVKSLGWEPGDLDDRRPPSLANAGAEHLLIFVGTRERLADLDYDSEALATLMRQHGLVTVDLVWRESRGRYHARNPAPGVGIAEDPATGAAAAALGGYLRESGEIGLTDEFTVEQGVDMGRPSLIEVSVIEGEPGVRIRGRALEISAAAG